MKYFLFVVLSLWLAACGRYGPPRPPEFFAAKKVSDISVTPAVNSITLNWRSPGQDVRGKELKSLDGYTIYRTKQSDIQEGKPLKEYMTKIGTVDDPNIKERERLRKEAKEKNQISHRIQISSEKRNFKFEDANLTNGETYVYMIEPFNQGDVKGRPSQLIKVLFRGEQSDISIGDEEEDLDTATLQSAFEGETIHNQGSDLFPVGK